MATIKFKSKIHAMRNVDGSHAYDYVTFPVLTRAHCDMQAFRSHPKFGAYANSDLFIGMLAWVKRGVLCGQDASRLRLDRIPSHITLNASGFLAQITIEV